MIKFWHTKFCVTEIGVSLFKMACFYLLMVVIFLHSLFFTATTARWSVLVGSPLFMFFFCNILSFVYQEMRVLVLLSNCNHVKSMIIPNVLKQCDKYGFEEIKGVQEVWIKDWKYFVWISHRIDTKIIESTFFSEANVSYIFEMCLFIFSVLLHSLVC